MIFNTEIPASWEKIDLTALHGVVMIVGEADTGKTTLAHYLFTRRAEAYPDTPVAFLDGDPGQSTLGPPTTLTLAVHPPDGLGPLEQEMVCRYFTGSVSPRGHMLEVVVGAARLWAGAQDEGARTLVHDTAGLVSPRAGGLALKNALIELLQPSLLIAIQRAGELEPLLTPLRRSGRVPVKVLSPAPAIRRRDANQRRKRRSELFRKYFKAATRHTIDWSRYGVFPGPHFTPNRLIAFEGRDGFMLGLGIVTATGREIEALTPLKEFDTVAGIHLGDLSLDPITYVEEAVQPGPRRGKDV